LAERKRLSFGACPPDGKGATPVAAAAKRGDAKAQARGRCRSLV